MTFEEMLSTYEKEISAIIRRHMRQNWRLEFDDLWQEVSISLWTEFPRIVQARDPLAYIKHCVGRCVKRTIDSFKRDALFNAVSLDQLEGYGIDIDEEGKPVMANPPHAPDLGG